MTIELPLPHKNLSPNARCHWAVKAKETQKHRRWAHLAAMNEMRKPGADIASMPWRKATAKARFYFRTKARRDEDNCASSLKPVWDGFADAGIWLDDCGVTHLPVEIHHDPHNPRLEIDVSENLEGE